MPRTISNMVIFGGHLATMAHWDPFTKCQIMFLVSLESSQRGGVHGLGSMTFGIAVQKFLNTECLLYWKLNQIVAENFGGIGMCYYLYIKVQFTLYIGILLLFPIWTKQLFWQHEGDITINGSNTKERRKKISIWKDHMGKTCINQSTLGK
jgi:hypothetical protein